MARKKKSYNPFKMWGAYVGFFIFVSPLFLLNGMSEVSGGDVTANWMRPDFYGLLAFILGLGVVGFLVGWGIHSLIRRLRK